MNHLVFLDPRAGELEKILSGVKSMLIRELNPENPTTYPLEAGDSLYFLWSRQETIIRGMASIVRVLPVIAGKAGNISHDLKEMQPRLQLTETQFEYWSSKQNVLLVEFNFAHKIPSIQVSLVRINNQADWLVFKELNNIKEVQE